MQVKVDAHREQMQKTADQLTEMQGPGTMSDHFTEKLASAQKKRIGTKSLQQKMADG